MRFELIEIREQSIFNTVPQEIDFAVQKNDKDIALKSCANMSNGSCLFEEYIECKCFVFKGKGCSYFANALFPAKTQRKCKCGNILDYKRRYCDKCRREKRKSTMKNAMRKYRSEK
jgi:hypothetical protein